MADGAHVPYAWIGRGPDHVVVIPGLGDAFATAQVATTRLRWHWARRGRRQRALYLCRRQPLPSGFTAAQHAADMSAALDHFGLTANVLECISGGGLIGQIIAAERPDLVRGLILSGAFHRVDDNLRGLFLHWLDLARRSDWVAVQWESIEMILRPRTAARYRPLRPLLRLLPQPRDPARVINTLEALLDVDQREVLPRIGCPTLVIGGAEDRVVLPALQEEMGRLIPRAEMVLYPGYGHGNDMENPACARRVGRFIAALPAR